MFIFDVFCWMFLVFGVDMGIYLLDLVRGGNNYSDY